MILYGERARGQLIVLSQVILSLQLPFAVFPLVIFTGDKSKMGGWTDVDARPGLAVAVRCPPWGGCCGRRSLGFGLWLWALAM